VHLVHLHLILNHIPVMGVGFGLLLLAAGAWKPSDELVRAALVTFVVVALIAIPTFLTGDPAKDVVKQMAGSSLSAIATHEEVAEGAFVVLEALGAAALGGLWMFRRRVVPQWFVAGALALCLCATLVAGWTANLGGQIRHNEIHSGVPPAIEQAR